MHKQLRVILIALVFVMAGVPSGGQSCPGCGPEDPEHGGCQECAREPGSSVAECIPGPPEPGEPSRVCIGGSFCFNTPTGTVCEPYCGELRCSSI